MVAANTNYDPTLKLGSQGDKVKELQALLNKRLSSREQIKVDGVFGSKTEDAVKIIQYQFLLKQDGIAGPLTWKSLRANSPVDKPTLRRGSTGEQVAIVQKVLKDGGYYNGAIDSNFGEKTETAVKAFQKDKKLLVDGIIGDKTWEALSLLASFMTVD
ncbi:peptidoglycan-binding domain-containing protein [Mastigocladopsis repens]|uniref:peptidoglycan-binding domain-containing protein n=1 Tax=Mastigocladopsis repens TaxID=221287 RepID=UPI0002DB624C|nr:peptidoglycan-binding protein [Mastigocladopsis repens]